MNGIDKISARIKADSDEEATGIMKEADDRCAAITAEWDEKARAECAARAASGREAADKLYERGCGAARLEAKKRVLAEKQKLVDEVFDHAEELLLSLPRDRYIALCAQLAASSSMTGSEELIFSEKDRADVGAEVTSAANALLDKQGRKAALRLSASTRGIRGGLVLSQKLVETNCSIGAMVSGLHGELAGEVASCLFH